MMIDQVIRYIVDISTYNKQTHCLLHLYLQGYSHLSCLVKYASSESRKVTDPDDGRDFTEAWRSCPNCNQYYMNQLQDDMVNEFDSFVKKEFPQSKWRRMLALLLKSAMLDEDDDIEKISYKMITLFKEMHANGENKFSSSMRMIEAIVYSRLGNILMDKEDKNLTEEILCHLDKAHKLYSIIGHDDAAAEVQMCMAKVLGDSQDPMSELKHWKMLYKKNIEEDGEGSSCAFYAGKELFKVLRGQEGKGVEAKRLLARLIKQSRLTHGPEHSNTKDLEKWNECMVAAKYKYLDMEYGMHMFELVRYESSMEKCILKGPVNPNTEENIGKILTFDANEIYLGLRSPVICHGSDYADHKGKVGEIMNWDKERDLYTIKFEDESLDPLEVKRTDTRVVLDLDACSCEGGELR